MGMKHYLLSEMIEMEITHTFIIDIFKDIFKYSLEVHIRYETNCVKATMKLDNNKHSWNQLVI